MIWRRWYCDTGGGGRGGVEDSDGASGVEQGGDRNAVDLQG